MTPEHYKVRTGDVAYSIIAGNIAPHLTTVQRSVVGNKIGAANGLRSLKVGEIIHYDPVEIPAPPPPVVEVPPVVPPIVVPPLGKIPALSAVGPRVAMRSDGSPTLAGPATATKFTAPGLVVAAGSSLTDCEARFAVSYGPNVRVDHTFLHDDTSTENGGHAGWEITWSRLGGGWVQALRPNGPGKIKISDSWLFTNLTPLTGDYHAEALQMMGGSEIEASRVAFSCLPRTRPDGSTPTTAVQTFEQATDGAGSVFTDCVFGAYDEATGKWSGGPWWFTIYPGQATYVRPVIYKGRGGYWYNNQPPTGARLVDPVYM